MQKIIGLSFFTILLCFSGFSQEEDGVEMVVATGVEIDSSGIAVEAQELYNQGITALEGNENRKAVAFFSQAIEIAPDFFQAYSNRAYGHLTLGELEEAKNDFRIAARLNEELHLPYFEMGAIAERQDSIDAAINYYSLAIERFRTEEKYHYQRGLQYFKLEDYTKAISDFNSAISLKPSFADALNDRGSANKLLNNLDQAILDYTAASLQNPQFTVAYANLGTAYREKGDYINALSAYAKALKIDKSNPVILNNRGYAYFLNGNLNEAITDFESALKINKDYGLALNNMAAAYIQKEEYEKAEEFASKAIKLNPDFGQAYCNRGIAREMQRKEKEACEDWSMASTLGINLGETYYHSSSCSTLFD
jgi:tetratricopeptide (TPR) repeat protein